MGPAWKPILPAILVSEAGFEPAKPASLAQYLCQFGYTDKLVGVEGVEPSPRGPRPRILPLYDTPMMKQAVFLLSGGLFKNSLFQMRILRLNRTVFGDLKGS